MANIKTIIEQWSVKDLEDGSSLNISVIGCAEFGNQSKPGIQVCYMGNTVNDEPLIIERWAYKATKENKAEHLIEDNSWMLYKDQIIKNYLVLGLRLK